MVTYNSVVSSKKAGEGTMPPRWIQEGSRNRSGCCGGCGVVQLGVIVNINPGCSCREQNQGIMSKAIQDVMSLLSIALIALCVAYMWMKVQSEAASASSRHTGPLPSPPCT